MSLIPSVITLGTEVVSRSQQGIVRVRACETLARLIRGLVGVLLRIQDIEQASTPGEICQYLKEMEYHLEYAKKLVDSACIVPAMYRTINAYKLSTDFKKVCQSLATGLEGLSLTMGSLSNNLAQTVKGDIQKLEVGFRKANFPLEKRELNIYNVSQRIATRVFNGKLPAGNGLEQMQDLLETTLGLQQIKDEWKEVAEQLLHDIDAARVRKDRQLEFYTRMLFWAVTGCDMPPPEFYCPISLEIMEDPVVLIETAVTYDKKSLDTWLHVYGSSRCPVSGQQLERLGYVENKALRCLIDDWKRHHMSQQEIVLRNELEQSLASSDEKLLDPAHVEDGVFGLDSQALEQKMEHMTGDMDAPGYDWSSRENAGRLPNSSLSFYDDTISERVYQESEVGRSVAPVPSTSALKTKHFPKSSNASIEKTNDSKKVMRRDVAKDIRLSCVEGDIDALKAYKEDGYSVDLADEDGKTCLHDAVIGGHIPIISFLLECGVDINATTKNDFATPLYTAACSGSTRVVRLLLSHRANIMIANKHGWSPLHAAADLGHAGVINEILQYAKQERLKTYPTMTTEAGWTVLHHAARFGSEKSMEYLLPFFHDVNHKCNMGYSALHVAVDNGKHSIVKMLLARGADPNIQSADGWAPIHVAQDKNDLDIGYMLLSHKANPDVAGKDGLTALHRAAFQNHLQFAKMLIDTGHADLKKRTAPKGENGRKAIEIASDLNHHEVYNLLFRRGFKAMFIKN